MAKFSFVKSTLGDTFTSQFHIYYYFDYHYYHRHHHNYNKILNSDWLSTVLISALIAQCNRTVRAIARAHLTGFFHCKQKKLSEFLVF